MSNFLIAVAVFVITVVAALFAVPYVVDWNGYRGVFEDEASRMLGREVRVGGAVNLHFLPSPYFSLEKVRIADTAGTLQEPFFRAEAVTIKLSVAPLLRGLVEAHEIELRRPALRLAIGRDDTWNWQKFAASWAEAQYLPTNVVLASVNIKDGIIALHGPDGQERAVYEGIAAELSAPALDGPYRVKATFGKAGAERDLRLATAKPEADGSVRVKATLRAADTATSYALEARISDLTGKIRVDGELLAKLPFSGLWPTQSRKSADEAFELKAQMRADAGQLELKNLALAFERDGQPQIVSGDLVARWRDTLAVETQLTSRWLDLDRIAGAKEGAGPLDSILPFAVRLRELLPGGGRSRAQLSIEQANIGGEAVSNLVLALVRAGDTLEIEALQAAMPGGSRGELSGRLTGPGEQLSFQGDVAVRGASLARFTHWASAGSLSSESPTDGTFGMKARLAIEPGRAALSDLAGELSGAALRGGVSYRWGQAQELGLAFEGPQLDARSFIAAGAHLGNVIALFAPGTTAEGPGKGLARLAGADLSLRVRAGQLLTAGARYRDVTVEIERKGGLLRVPVLRLSGDDGFEANVEGEVADLAGKPKGSLRLAASADTAGALRALGGLLGIADDLLPEAARLQGLVPLRIAGAMTFGARLEGSVDVAAGGEAGGGRIRVASRMDGGNGGWRSGPADISVAVENPDASAIAALVLPVTGSLSTGSTARKDGQQPGRILLRAGGVPNEGLATLLAMEANDTTLAFEGRLKSSPERHVLSGDLGLKGVDGTRLASLARLSPPLRLGEFPVNGTMRLSTDGKVIDVERFSLDAGGVALRGRFTLAPEGRRQRLSGHIETDAMSVTDLIAPLLDRRLGAATAAAEAVLQERPSLWPDQPFHAGAFDALAGEVSIAMRRLEINGPVALDNASLRVQIGDGRMVLRQISGEGLKSTWSAAMTITRVPTGGAEIAGTLQADSIDIASAVAGATGKASAKVSFAGRGVSPRAMLASLQGDGTAVFQSAAVPGAAPSAVSLAVDASLKAGPEGALPALRQTLVSSLARATLGLPQQVGLEIGDGQLRSRPLRIETPSGVAEGRVLLDLGTLAVLSDWKLFDTVLATASRTLPAVGVQYRGPLAALGRIEPQTATDALEREVTVRRMERDVDELERLRRLDEARRREDAERLREQLERAPPPPPAPVQAPAAPVPQVAPRPQPAPKSSFKSLFPW